MKMKKLVKVALAPNDIGILFSLEEAIGGRLDANGAFKVIEQDAYSELIRGDGANEREGYIAYIPKAKYDELRRKGEID